MNTKMKAMKRWIINKINQIRGIQFLLLTTMLFFCGLTSCTFDTNEYKPIVVPETVSFEGDIVQPIFTPNCAYSGCHSQNGIPPVLTPEEAYNELLFGYVNTEIPSQSLLYKKIATGGSMAVYASDQDRQIILKWIEQGASNN